MRWWEKKTAQVLQEYNLQADFIPPDFIADSMAENFPESLRGKQILFPRVETGGEGNSGATFNPKGGAHNRGVGLSVGLPQGNG